MERESLTRQAEILGALLHDIGKFVQRSQDNPAGQDHSHWGEEWFENVLAEKLTGIFNDGGKQIIRTAINNHHEYEEYITLADAISAGMERISMGEEEKGDPLDRLISIFSRISISYHPKKDKYCRLAPLGKDALKETFPIEDKKCASEEYNDLLVAFNEEIKSLNSTSPQQAIEQIYFLLWKYAWCIPSATYKYEPDVSLFDHLKTTAAIAICLYDYHLEYPEEELNIDSPMFQLIGGDISGIQKYIFEVLTQQGKVAKRLRSRSLVVQLISEIASHKILHAFDLPLCNLIISAGGNFYILAPNLRYAGNKITQLQTEFDKWTFKNLNAELFVSLANVEVSSSELGEFSKALDDLNKRLHWKKNQPHKSMLITDSKWLQGRFLRDEIIEGDEKACQGCHKNPITQSKPDNLCNQCLSDIEIGKILPNAKYIAFFKNSGRGASLLNYSFELWPELQKDTTPYLVLALNNTNQKGIGFKYITNNIPTENSEPIPFNNIADKSEGDKLLGYLKADIDNMGKILREGFRETKPSISRFNSFSRMLEIFFSGYLQMRLNSDYNILYTIFSGGDDLFLVGPWNKIVDFAKEIRNQFSLFCGENPDLTFSAGIILSKPYEPISFCTTVVEKELDESKKEENKDRVTLFNQTLKWDELTKIILPEAKRVIEWLETEPPKVSRPFIYNLRQYAQMYQQYENTKETKYLKFVPLLNYDIYRNLTKREQEDVKEWALKLSPTIIKDKLEKNNLPYLWVIMEYVLTYTRG